jgi:multisubunit Na+/H+ antiporter MnhC subunit
MGIKLGKNGKLAGENLIQAGILFCFLGVLLYLISAFSGVINGFTLLGAGVLGLLMICAGYLKRISAALMSSVGVAESAPAAN